MSGIDEVIRKMSQRRAAVPGTRSLLVGISGIDGCGKGYLAGQIEAHPAQHAVTSAVLNVDGWLNLPHKRFDQSAPAKHFYENAYETIYFPAQCIHLAQDKPCENADLIFDNDSYPKTRLLNRPRPIRYWPSLGTNPR